MSAWAVLQRGGWSSGKNPKILTTFFLFDAELEQSYFFFLNNFLFLTFRMTQHGPISIVPNLMSTLRRWRHRALVVVVVNVFHLEP